MALLHSGHRRRREVQHHVASLVRSLSCPVL
jgi:hypothetical protein